MGEVLKKHSDGRFSLSHKESNWWIGDSDHDKVKAHKGEQILSKLSLKNCEAIELGCDLDYLARCYVKSPYGREWDDFKAGFQKALQILGDKKFSEDDVNLAFVLGKNKDESRINKLINSRLQQTEWDVEIEMEDIFHLKNRRGGLTNMGKPKLDADGCLILKRK